MTTPPPSGTSTIDLAVELRLTMPEGDDRTATSTVLNAVLERAMAMQDDLLGIGNTHLDEAPASSQHILDLNVAMARTVLDWIERWPS